VTALPEGTPAEAPTPTALVVYESLFGNTALVARAVAASLRDQGFTVTSYEVSRAPRQPGEHDLLVVGAPTHAFSLSRPTTRADAVRQGAAAGRAAYGLREWLAGMRATTAGTAPLAAVFDTRVTKVRHIPKSASSRAARFLHHLGFHLVDRTAHFLVEDVSGPLLPGELDRAARWGGSIARTCREHLAALSTTRGS
jgi:hypothetical protein